MSPYYRTPPQLCSRAAGHPGPCNGYSRVMTDGKTRCYEADLSLPPATAKADPRKSAPIFSGVMRYFPDALAAVARLSKAGNDKHNPGEPLHWARGKSIDHGDCIARHQITFDKLDEETGELHATAVAWRALAQLQLLEEKRLGKAA